MYFLHFIYRKFEDMQCRLRQMFIHTFQLREARAAVSDPVYTCPARLLNRQVPYFMCNAFTRNRANSFTDCSTVYTSQHKFAGRLKTCTAVGSTSPM